MAPKLFFMNAYTKETHEAEEVRMYTKRLHVILDAKYERPF